MGQRRQTIPARRSLELRWVLGLGLWLLWASGIAQAQESGQACDPWDAAPEPLFLYGVESGCRLDPHFARDIETEVEITHHRLIAQVWVDRPAWGCVGRDCANAVTAWPGSGDPPKRGTLLGSRVEYSGSPGAIGPRLILWRHDLSSGQTFEYALDARICQGGVCGDGRFADQDVSRMRPSQRVAVAMGRLMQGRVDGDFVSCRPGCAPGEAAQGATCSAPAPRTCPASTSSLSAGIWGGGGTHRPRALAVARGMLAVGFAAGAASLIGMGAIAASPLGEKDGCAQAGSPYCLPLRDILQTGLITAGAATTLFAIGLATTWIVERREVPTRLRPSGHAAAAAASPGGNP